MTKLATLHAEASRSLGLRARAASRSGVAGGQPPRRLRRLGEALVPLCEAHWAEIRGPKPAGGLEQALWELAPPLADLFVHLHGSTDPRLADALGSCTPAQALAVLVEAEIGRGNSEGARLAYDAMMLFDSPGAREVHTRDVMRRLARSGSDAPMPAGRHLRLPALARAVAAIAHATGRYDLAALLASIRVLAQAQAGAPEFASDPRLASLLAALSALGLRFCGLNGARLLYALRGAQKAPVPVKRLADTLARLRRERGL
jgi:hypothetical protein